jgi:hypothetical protein
LAGIVNGVGGEVFLGDSGFVEHDPGYLSTVTTRRSYFTPLDQSIDDRRGDIRIEPNQVGPRRGRKVDPPCHTRLANVSKEPSKLLFVVATNHLAKLLFVLGLEDEDGHLRFAHFGTAR